MLFGYFKGFSAAMKCLRNEEKCLENDPQILDADNDEILNF